MSRSKRARSGLSLVGRAEWIEYDNWRGLCAKVNDDPEALGDLYEIGRDKGWLTTGGTLVPPGTDPPPPTDDLNAAIRRAAGRR